MTALTDAFARVRAETDQSLKAFLPLPADKKARVFEAMRYAAIGGGKALRPFLVTHIGRLLNADEGTLTRIAAALEMVHTYSLIHDDLPAMDNDSLRRGKATTHVFFDEATAILAGDALLTRAFEILADPATHPDAAVRCRLIAELAKAAGADGMIGGQMIDLIGEKIPLTADEIKQMQTLKTGALLRFSCLAPVIAAGASQKTWDLFEKYAAALGILFQITDDLLDACGDTQTLGKTTHKDSQAGKSTFVAAFGIDKAREVALAYQREAQAALARFDGDTNLLTELLSFIITRDR